MVLFKGLIPPDDLLKACQNMSKLKLPYKLRKLNSGLLVIQNTSITDSDIATQVKEVLSTMDGGVLHTELSLLMDISIFMAVEYTLIAESHGLICRDDSVHGSRFYSNKIIDYKQ